MGQWSWANMTCLVVNIRHTEYNTWMTQATICHHSQQQQLLTVMMTAHISVDCSSSKTLWLAAAAAAAAAAAGDGHLLMAAAAAVVQSGDGGCSDCWAQCELPHNMSHTSNNWLSTFNRPRPPPRYWHFSGKPSLIFSFSHLADRNLALFLLIDS